ncbi:DUF2726 domain-containing protein [Aliiglaciecola sp. 3_MG-2023]|uniref:DUF2726 domain-containing protein n=1 Tax=Aliiglaciecola sp. 3_MG-2023 TaxID=3062644 RepID=UPI0026E337FB|nr:DUF2726 domain-containing protein [Aliiglaciecola sp. 3_MG-2023]MDO6695124.1 DUF2726 domain-containing protein [Aliiglaciecola sp. 3_MG-2023]
MELAIILMMMLIIVAIAALKLSDNGLSFPFKRKASLLTHTELSFLDLIESAMGQRYRVLCRTRLSEIVSLRQNTDKRAAKHALIKASSRQLDFVLCHKSDMSPVMAIDLVHNGGKDGYKTQRDWYVTSALDAARIPHLRIKVKSGYTKAELKECIDAKLATVQRKTPKPVVPGTNNPDNPRADKPKRPIRSNRPVAA